MAEPFHDLLKIDYPTEEKRFFTPISIGNTPEMADWGAALILNGTKTAMSSGLWDFPSGHIPFAGALSVLLDGSRRPRAIVETTRVEVMPFSAVDASFARAYGEGKRTLAWFRVHIGQWYRDAAARHGKHFTEDTLIVCEWFKVVRVISSPA
jgi:uncharacterized protein YhfF